MPSRPVTKTTGTSNSRFARSSAYETTGELSASSAAKPTADAVKIMQKESKTETILLNILLFPPKKVYVKKLSDIFLNVNVYLQLSAPFMRFIITLKIISNFA